MSLDNLSPSEQQELEIAQGISAADSNSGSTNTSSNGDWPSSNVDYSDPSVWDISPELWEAGKQYTAEVDAAKEARDQAKADNRQQYTDTMSQLDPNDPEWKEKQHEAGQAWYEGDKQADEEYKKAKEAAMDKFTGSSSASAAANSDTATTDFGSEGNSSGRVHQVDVFATYKISNDMSTKSAIAGSVGSALEAFRSAAHSGKLSGDGYEAMLSKLEIYELAFKKLSKLCDVFGNNVLSAANSLISGYISTAPARLAEYVSPFPGSDLGKRGLVQADFDSYKACYDDDMTLVLKGEGNNTYWDYKNAPHAKGVDLPNMKELRECLTFLDELPGWDSYAINMVDPINSECVEFNTKVNEIQVSQIK